ncbi:Retrovirus-related Pol polyprotein from transposon, partial [Trichinella patagoniensis]
MENGNQVVIAYISRALTRPEQRYCVTRKEMLALVWAVKQFRPYLYGQKFTARTDHHSLRWLRNFREPEGQVARWLEQLAEETAWKCRCSIPAVVQTVRDGVPVSGHLIECHQLWGGENMIKQWQEDDPEIQQVIKWLSTNSWPDKAPEGSRILKSLWAQRRRMKMTNGVLTREWEALGTNKKTMLP